jgi:2-keto-4-pentenoate hydratase
VAVKVRLLHRSLDDGEQPAGWRVGLASERARRALGTRVRPVGDLAAGHVFASGAEMPASTVHQPSIEIEFLLTGRRPMRHADVTPAHARAGIDRVTAGL